MFGVTSRQQVADRLAARQQRHELVVRHAWDQQAHVEEVRIGRIEPLAGLVQRLETGAESRRNIVESSGHQRFGRFDGFASQPHLVDLAEIVHLPREQFHQQMRKTQREEVGHEIGIQLFRSGRTGGWAAVIWRLSGQRCRTAGRFGERRPIARGGENFGQ